MNAPHPIILKTINQNGDRCSNRWKEMRGNKTKGREEGRKEGKEKKKRRKEGRKVGRGKEGGKREGR